jgi:predicted transcriptional regulator
VLLGSQVWRARSISTDAGGHWLSGPSGWHTHGMARRRTTLYLDDELLQAAAEWAARTGRAQRDVIEEALRRYLGLETTVRRTQARGDLDEDESLALAYRELDAHRAECAEVIRAPRVVVDRVFG